MTNSLKNHFLSRFLTSLTNGPRSLSHSKASTHSTFREKSHTSAYTPKQGHSLLRIQRGFALPAKSSPKEQPEKVDARLMACVRFLRRRGPAGLRSLDAVVSAAVSASALLCLRLYLQLHHRPLLLFRFLAELLRVVVETHAGLLLTVFLHLPQQNILLRRVEPVAPALLGTVALAEC